MHEKTTRFGRLFCQMGLLGMVPLVFACGDGQIGSLGGSGSGEARGEYDFGRGTGPDASTNGGAGAGDSERGGGSTGSGDSDETGESAGTGGAAGAGASTGSGGTAGSAGSPGSGGISGSGSTGGSIGSGGTAGTGDSVGSGGSSGAGGSSGSGGPGTPGGAYGYVTPADVGTLVGAGSNGYPTPTEPFSGGSIDAPTTIENKVITGAVSVNANDVIFRNVHFQNGARTMISVARGVSGLTIDNSTIECTATPSESGSKQVLVGEDLIRLTVRRTELTGCARLFILDGNLDGFLWEHNVRHQVGPGFEPNGHSVGLHVAYFEPTYGDMTIRGSYFAQDDTTSYTDQISFGFSGHSNASLVVQDSYFDQDLNYTIRCTANTDCAIVNNVFSASVWVATQFQNGTASFDCNRRPDGSFVGSDALIGAQANNTGCRTLP